MKTNENSPRDRLLLLTQEVQLSKIRDGTFKFVKTLKKALVELDDIMLSTQYTKEQSKFILDLYSTYREQVEQLSKDFWYSVTIKVFVSEIVLSFLYLFIERGLR